MKEKKAYPEERRSRRLIYREEIEEEGEGEGDLCTGKGKKGFLDVRRSRDPSAANNKKEENSYEDSST